MPKAMVQTIANRLVHPAGDCVLHLPARIADFTDFCAGIHYADIVGTISLGSLPNGETRRYLADSEDAISVASPGATATAWAIISRLPWIA